jgi:hypothetical protein
LAGEKLALENEYVKLQLRRAAGGSLTQEIFAKGERSNEWKLVLVGEKPITDKQRKSSKCKDIVLVADGSVNDIKLSGDPSPKKGAQESLTIRGLSKKHNMKITFTLTRGTKWLHVLVEDKIKGKSVVEALESSYSFVPEGRMNEEVLPLDFCWVPNLRPKENYVIGDHVFRSPAVIVQKSKCLAALVPNLDLLSSERKMKTAVEFNLKPAGSFGPTLGYGFKEYKATPHVYYQHDVDMAKPFKNQTMTYGYYILVDCQADPRDGFRQVVRFLWAIYASDYLKQIEPQVLSFDEYAKRAYNCMFKENDIWREVDFEGKRIGGTIWQTQVDDEKEAKASEIKNQALFNNLRVAYGMYHYGTKWGDKSLAEKACIMKNLALAAPAEKGIFASVLSVGRWLISWTKGTRASENYEFYHTADDAWTGYWMLQWYRDFEQDKALLDKATALGAFYIEAQLPSGAIPSWVRIRDGRCEAVPPLEESATTACPAFFLVELYKVTGSVKYLTAAEKAAEFIEKAIIPKNKWFDFELYFSTCGNKGELSDEYTGLSGQNSLSLWWAAELFISLHDATGNKDYLDVGSRLMDLLCLYQQVWNPPYLSVYTFGGFGVTNSDAEWNDARQSMFAATLMHYYNETREEEYFERGIAALRASFALMFIPEHKGTTMKDLPDMRSKDYGFIPENYGHSGEDRFVPGSIHFDCGSGSSASAAAYVERRFGDVYVDVEQKKAFGINGCIIDQVALEKGKPISFVMRKQLLKFEEMKITLK